METSEVLESLQRGFGAQTSIRERRPRSLFQVSIPIFLEDGDGVSVYLHPLADGRIRVTDLGRTVLRLSYVREVSEDNREALRGLADRHGFVLDRDELTVTTTPPALFGAVLGLAQVQAEAEASIMAAATRGPSSEQFRELVMDILRRAFKESCRENFYDPKDDPNGLFKLDALIEGRADVPIMIVPSDKDAERAVGVKFTVEKSLRHGVPHRWIAIARDINSLQNLSRQRLMLHFDTLPIAAPEVIVQRVGDAVG